MTVPAHMRALGKASEVKRDRGALKRAMAAHELSLPAALGDPRAQGMRVWDLLIAQCTWGKSRVERALAETGRVLWPSLSDAPPLDAYRTVRSLTSREREALLRVCAGGGW
jgi:hypothetical protein